MSIMKDERCKQTEVVNKMIDDTKKNIYIYIYIYTHTHTHKHTHTQKEKIQSQCPVTSTLPLVHLLYQVTQNNKNKEKIK